METRKYYEAYEDRYQVAHAAGLRWFGDAASPIVGQTCIPDQFPEMMYAVVKRNA